MDAQATAASGGCIRRLNAYSAQRIGAEQVIISLADAVKELVENCLDAHSTQISVNFCNYGIDWFEIADDGCGIADADFELLGQRSATSKLVNFDELDTVSTFGFRGEALHSVCVLAERVIIITRSESARCATRIVFNSVRDEDGAMRVSECTRDRCARQRGTTIRVEKLFASVPVRRTDFIARARSSELTKALARIEQYAVVSMGVRFGCVNMLESRSVQLLRTSGAKGQCKPIGSMQLSNTEWPSVDGILANVTDLFGPAQAAALQRLETSYPPPAEYVAAFGVDVTSRTFVPRQFAERKTDRNSKKKKKSKADVDSQELSQNDASESNGESESTSGSEAEAEDSESQVKYSLCGFITRPDCSRSQLQTSSARQYFFINGRPVEFVRLSQVVNETFRAFSSAAQPATATQTQSQVQVQSQSQSPSVSTPSPSSAAASGGRCYPFVILNVVVSDRTQVDANRTADKRSVFVRDEAQLLATVKHSLECLFRGSRYLQISQPLASVGKKQEQPQSMLMQPPSDSSVGPETNGGVASSHNTASPAPKQAASAEKEKETSGGTKRKVMPLSDFLKLHAVSTSSSRPSSVEVEEQPAATSNSNSLPRRPSTERRLSETETETEPTPNGSHGPENENRNVVESATVEVVAENLRNQDQPESTAAESGTENGGPVDLRLHPCARRVPVSYDQLAGTWKRARVDALSEAMRQKQSGLSGSAANSDSDHLFTAQIEPAANELAERELRTRFEKRYFSQLQVIGQFNLGFIIAAHRRKRLRLGEADNDTDLFIIDQHAADEKATFERFERSLNLASRTQRLIKPIELSLSDSDKLKVIENLDVFRRNGFSVVERSDDEPPIASLFPNSASAVAEPEGVGEQESDKSFGTEMDLTIDEDMLENGQTHEQHNDGEKSEEREQPSTIPKNSASNQMITDSDWPCDFPETQIARRSKLYLTTVPILGRCTLGFQDFQELLGLLHESESECDRVRKRPSRIRAVLASRACRQSIMIGTSLKRVEMKSILAKLTELEQPWNCPHGRPTIRHLCHL